MPKDCKDTPNNRHIMERSGIGVTWNIRVDRTALGSNYPLGFISLTCDDSVTQQHAGHGGIFFTQAREPLLGYMRSCDSLNIFWVELFACLKGVRIAKESGFNTLYIALNS